MAVSSGAHRRFLRVEPMTLVEQIARLRQLAIADPDTSLLELTLINALAELADAV